MPTFARLVGAVLLAALGAYVSTLAKPYLPDGEPAGMLIPVSAAVGVVIGWTFLGRQVENGGGRGPAVGLGSAILLAFWVAFLFAVEEMVDRSMRGGYGGSPTHAVQDVFNILIDYTDVLQLDVILAMGVGGIIVGWITAFVGRHTR